MADRSVYCGKCEKSYYPCKSTESKEDCCKKACGSNPTLKKGGSVRAAVGPNRVL
tara:strand:- start:1346 stop:1510 length:165 start_codon:yes stop_codon:yes gene_type:complete